MKTRLISLLVFLVMLNAPGVISGACAEEDAVVEDTAADVVTLEEAVELAVENSRDMASYELNKEKAKYQMYKAQDTYKDTVYDSYGLMHDYNILSSEYSELLQKQDRTEDENDRLDEIEIKMDQLNEQMKQHSDQEDSVLDQKEDAEDNYDDIVARQGDYEKQLAYTVAQLYINILNQEGNLQALGKEYVLKQKLHEIENKKLLLGSTDRASVDTLAMELKQLDSDMLSLGDLIITQKGKLNDMMGRKYADELALAHFEVPESVELPEIETLISKAAGKYEGLEAIKKQLDKKRDERDSVSRSDYQYNVLQLEIKELNLQLEEEKLAMDEKINNLITDVQSKLEEYQITLTNYADAQQNYARDQTRFELGRISKLDLLQSELNCQNAKDKSVSTGYSFYLTCRALELAEDGILVN